MEKRKISFSWDDLLEICLKYLMILGLGWFCVTVVYRYISSEIYLLQINKEPILTTGVVTRVERVSGLHKPNFRNVYTYNVHGTEYSGMGFVYDHHESIKLDPGTKIKIIYKKSDPSKSVIATPDGKVPL